MGDPDEEELYNPIVYERDDTPPTVPDSGWTARPAPAAPWWTPALAPPRPAMRPVAQDPSWPPRLPERRRPPRWLLAAVVAVLAAAAAAGTAFALAGSPAARPAGPASGLTPPIAPAAARGVLSRYAAANNAANARMDSGLLAAIETGSSQVIDSTAYLVQRARGAAPPAAFAPSAARFYLPREPATGPRWFAVAVTNRALGGQRPVLGTGYLLFTQAGPGAPWKVAAGPFLLGGPGVPPVALDAGGYATAVTPDTAGLAVAPDRIAAETARSAGGHGPVRNPDPGSLTDSRAVTSQRPRLPAGSAVSDTWAPAGYPVVGLRTAGGGALVFYTDAATVTYQAPPGRAFTLDIPGLYGPGQPLRRAGLRILDQFAAYDPPAGHGTPRVVAAYSGISSKL